MFLNHATPLQPASKWDVANDPPSTDQIDKGVQAHFGIFPEADNKVTERTFNLLKNQVFKTEDYQDVILGLQAAQAKGDGVVYATNLTTIENEWWGVPGGLEVEVVFVYLGRLSSWEADLSQDMQSRVVPSNGDPSDMSNTIDNGIFRHFPHYYTAGGLLTHQQSNLLADLSGWNILQHKELFERIFS